VNGKSLMAQYAEGQLIGRELNDMMREYAAQARFDREMVDDIDLYADRQKVTEKEEES